MTPAHTPRDEGPLRGALRRRVWRARRILPGNRVPRLPEWPGPATTLPPIIVGGTGRSGTTITGRLLGAHPDYHMIPFEVRFLSSKGGLTDLVAGKTTIMAFERLLLDRWFDRGHGKGLFQITDPLAIRAAIRELDADLDRDPLLAARRFAHRLLDPPAVMAGARGWLEETPGTLTAARQLARVLPDARFVHIVRDGRDAACSVTPLRYGPTDLRAALRWWERRLERSYAGAAGVPPERLLTIRMESLLLLDRDETYRRLLEFVGLSDDPAIRAFFDEKVSGDRAHIARWRHDVPDEMRASFLAAYREAAEGLGARWGYEPELVPEEGPAT
jgi:hypothetical protein